MTEGDASTDPSGPSTEVAGTPSKRESLEARGIWVHPELSEEQLETIDRLYGESLHGDANDMGEKDVKIATDPVQMARETTGEARWSAMGGVERLRVLSTLGWGKVNERVATTPGGIITADPETNVLHEIVDEHHPEHGQGPVPLTELGTQGQSGARFVVEDLLPDGQLVTLVGEEGEGKSTLCWQIGCEVASGHPVGGHFAVPEPVSPVLIVDVEQTEEDALILRDDMLRRGLDVSNVFWLDANGRSFDLADDQKWLTHWVRAFQPRLLILDTGTEAVTKAREDESVKLLFILLNRLMKADGVRSILMLSQARKRSQEARGRRRFDDTFGSRVWKGRSSAVLYLEQDKITVWKQRGSYLKRRWGADGGTIVRSDDAPTQILGPKSAEEVDRDRREKIIWLVRQEPGVHSKTALLEERLKTSGHERPGWRRVVDDMVAAGEIHPEGRYSKLYPGPSAPIPPVA